MSDTPICHLTVGPRQWYHSTDGSLLELSTTSACLTSCCSAWVTMRENPRYGRCGLIPADGEFIREGTDPVPSEPSVLDEPAWQALSPLSTRTTKALRDRLPASLWGDDCGDREVTVRELCELTPAWLLKMRNFARRSLKEVEVALKEHGLRLSTVEEWLERQEQDDRP